MRPKLLAAAAIVVAAMSTGAAQASHSWNGYHWARTSNPFTLKLGDNVDPVWDSTLRTTSSDWSKSTVLNTTVVAGLSPSKNCKATLGRVEVCNAGYGSTGWLGVARISIAKGTKHITSGTVRLNDTYFATAKYNTQAWRNLVSCQEVGHTLGLDHQDENPYNANLGTCMDYTNRPATNQHPNSHDYAELATIYRHLDGTTTLRATATRARQQATGTGTTPWGRRTGGSRASGHSTYVHDLGHGKAVITFVTWASPGD